VQIDFDVYPYRTTGSPLYLLIPNWARQGGFTELFKLLANKDERQKIIAALNSHTLHYDKILIISAKDKSAVGHSVAELAEESGLTPPETIVELIRVNEGRVTILGQTVSMENTRLAIRDPNSFIVTDGAGLSTEAQTSGDLTHPRSFGAFARFLGKFAPELKLSLPEAIQKITAGPARKFNLKNRGFIAKKYAADLVVFDPKIIKDRATYKNPYQYAEGIEWVVVNGKIAVENGRVTGQRVGKILRKQ
jgi:N-acyl-D-aspartate/D-glutamate deacylase